MSLPTRPLTLTINGRRRGPIDVPEGMMMIDVLHEMLDWTGSRLGCGQGICHACVVIWDRDDQTSEEVPDLHHRRGLLRRQAHPYNRGCRGDERQW